MNKEKVLGLAKLARIELGNDEAESLSREFRAILEYVGEIKNANPDSLSSAHDKNAYALRNVMREDIDPHEPGLYSKKILEQAPDRDSDFIKVKKIL